MKTGAQRQSQSYGLGQNAPSSLVLNKKDEHRGRNQDLHLDSAHIRVEDRVSTSYHDSAHIWVEDRVSTLPTMTVLTSGWRMESILPSTGQCSHLVDLALHLPCSSV